jgi:hypothetical protein
MVVTPTSMRWPWKNVRIDRLFPGSHSRFATPIMPMRRLIDTTSLVASLVPTSPRMMTRSRNRPNAGASTSSTNATATGVGHPHWNRSCQ